MSKSMLIRSGLPLIIIIGAIVVAAVMIGSRKPPEQKPVEEQALLVDARAVEMSHVDFAVNSQGNVLPLQQTQLSAQVSGRVVAVSQAFIAGGMVNKGDVLLTLEQDDYRTDVKLAEAELAQAQAALDEEIARGKVAEQEWRSVSTVPPELGLRKPQLAREQANVKAAEAKLERAKRNLDRTRIRAPYNAIVVSRDVDLGQFIGTGAIVGEIYGTDTAEVRLPLTDTDLAFLDLSQGVSNNNAVRLTARVAGKQRYWDAQLVRSEGVLDAGNRVIYAIAKIDDPYRRVSDDATPVLRFGQFVQAVISGTNSRDLIVLPRSILRLDNTVLTVSDERELTIQDVEVVRSDTTNVYVGSGLSAGQLVVYSAVPNPFNGMKVRLPSDEPPAKDKSEDTTPITANAGEAQ